MNDPLFWTYPWNWFMALCVVGLFVGIIVAVIHDFRPRK